jgi:hypothetical protein
MPRNFPNWLKAYMHYTRASEAPDQFHLWTGISTVAGALRRRVWINENTFQWTPNMYVILVGPAGVANKSTSLRQGQELLSCVPNIHFGPAATTWQKLTLSMQEASDELILYDENHQEIKHKMSCLTFYVSELGTFFRLDDEVFISVLIDLFDGQASNIPWAYETKSSGSVEIKNPWINLLGCTTPAWIQSNFPEAMIGGGLTSRIIFVYGDRKRQLVAYPSRVVTSKEHTLLREQIIDDLQSISTMSGEMKLTEDAIKWGTSWYEALWNQRPVHMASDRYGGYISRKQTHLHKIAMILSASEGPSMIIDESHLLVADKLLTSVEPDMIKVYESVGVVDEAVKANELAAYVKAYKWISIDDLWKLCRNIMQARMFEFAVRQGVKDGTFVVSSRDGKQGISLRVT